MNGCATKWHEYGENISVVTICLGFGRVKMSLTVEKPGNSGVAYLLRSL